MGRLENWESGVDGLIEERNWLGLFVNDSVERSRDEGLVGLTLLGEHRVSEGFRLEAFFLFRDASGSLMKMHSRPREVHLEQGY